MMLFLKDSFEAFWSRALPWHSRCRRRCPAVPAVPSACRQRVGNRSAKPLRDTRSRRWAPGL